MPALRLFVHLMLALALLVGGLAPGVAKADATGEDLAMVTSCHELAGDPAGPADAAPADCCDDGGCACNCWHQVQLGVPAAPPLSGLRVHGVEPLPAGCATPVASAGPEIRPPIA